MDRGLTWLANGAKGHQHEEELIGWGQSDDQGTHGQRQNAAEKHLPVAEPIRHRTRDYPNRNADNRYQGGDLPQQGYRGVQVLRYERVERSNAQKVQHPEKAGDSYGDGQPVDEPPSLYHFHSRT